MTKSFTYDVELNPVEVRIYLNGLISAQTFSMAEAPLGQGSASGQPLEISYGEGKTARYTYDAAGRRLSLEHGTYTWVVEGGVEPVNPGIGGGSGTGLATAPEPPGESAPSGESSGAPSAISRPGKLRRVFTAESRRDYCGAFLYADGVLERILTDNGWYSPGGTYTAVINDHQGNLRATASWKFSSSSSGGGSGSGIGVIEFGAPAKGAGSPASAPGALTAYAGADAGTASGNGAGAASPQGIGTIGGPIGGGIVMPVDPNRNRRYTSLTAYSPYGLPLADWQGDDERYLYSGKELDRDGGLWLYDFHARQYDPQLGRFTTPAPLQEKYLPLSPYLYCAANPISLIDPSGCEIYIDGDPDAVNKTVSSLNSSTQFKFLLDENNKLNLLLGIPKSINSCESLLMKAALDPDIRVNIDATKEQVKDGAALIVGNFDGSTVNPDGTVDAHQTINPYQAEIADNAYEMGQGVSALHEVMEAYSGALNDPGTGQAKSGCSEETYEAYWRAHESAQKADPRSKPVYIGHSKNDDGTIDLYFTEKATGFPIEKFATGLKTKNSKK